MIGHGLNTCSLVSHGLNPCFVVVTRIEIDDRCVSITLLASGFSGLSLLADSCRAVVIETVEAASVALSRVDSVSVTIEVESASKVSAYDLATAEVMTETAALVALSLVPISAARVAGSLDSPVSVSDRSPREVSTVQTDEEDTEL